jgi:hypothetical protein
MDWKKLKHAQGPATRVPKQIDALGAAESLAAEESYVNLVEALVAPGQFFSASAPAVALLLDQLAPKQRGKQRVLWLLGDIVAADHLWLIAQPPGSGPRSSDAKATLAEAAKAIAPARKLLGDPEPAVRAAAVFFLALVPGGDAALKDIAAIASGATEAPELRAGAALALGVLAREGNREAKAALERLPSEGLLGAGVWAGKTVAGIASSKAELASGASAWFAPLDASLMPWGRMGNVGALVDALVQEPEQRAAVAPAIVERFAAQGVDDRKRRRAVGDLALRFAGFNERFSEWEIAPPESLSDAQRKTAAALAHGMPDVVISLGWGMPGSASAVERSLELAPASPLEQQVAGKKRRWQRARALIDAKKPFDAVLADLFADLPPGARLEMAEELLRGSYRILSDAKGKIPPTLMAQLVEEAGKDGIVWAQAALERGAAARRAGLPTHLLGESHWAVAFRTLIAAGKPLRPEWDDALPFAPADVARPILTQIPRERLTALVLRKLATASGPGKGELIKNVLEIIDLFDRERLVGPFRDAMTDRFAKLAAGPATAKKLAAIS